MKKIFLSIVMAFFAITAFAQDETSQIRIPSGYQGFAEVNSCWHFDKNMPTTVQLSTTHGFYFNGHIYAGIGVGWEFNNSYFLMPFYANVRYVFLNKTAVSPLVSMRLGTFYSSKKMGTYGDLALGVRFASKRDFALSVMVVGTYYDKLAYKYYDQYQDAYGNWHTEYVETGISPSSISLRVGIEW